MSWLWNALTSPLKPANKINKDKLQKNDTETIQKEKEQDEMKFKLTEALKEIQNAKLERQLTDLSDQSDNEENIRIKFANSDDEEIGNTIVKQNEQAVVQTQELNKHEELKNNNIKLKSKMESAKDYEMEQNDNMYNMSEQLHQFDQPASLQSSKKRKPNDQLDEIEEKYTGAKRQRLDSSQFAAKRPGGIRYGDVPIRIKRIILLEGEPMWETEWESGNELPSGQIQVILDSFERQSNLVKWNQQKFNDLKLQYINSKNIQ